MNIWQQQQPNNNKKKRQPEAKERSPVMISGASSQGNTQQNLEKKNYIRDKKKNRNILLF